MLCFQKQFKHTAPTLALPSLLSMRLVVANTPFFSNHPNPRIRNAHNAPMSSEEAARWAYEYEPDVSYDGEPYFNLYALLLWTMKKAHGLG